jgi:hypothetical protein
LWTELVRISGRIAAIGFEATTCIDEIENLCIRLAESARGDQEILGLVKKAREVISIEMGTADTLRGVSQNFDEVRRTDPRDLIADALETAKQTEIRMRASRDSLILPREKLKEVLAGRQPKA